MEDSFAYHSIESLLLDDDFCGWVRGEKPELEEYYSEKLKQFPEKARIVNTVISIISTLSEDQQKVPLSRKIEIWEEATKRAKAKKRKPVLAQFLKYAAVFIVSALITAVVYYFVDYDGYEKYMASTPPSVTSNETKLILGNGEEIEILTEEANIIYKNKGTQVEVDGKEKYEVESKGKAKTTPTYNQVIVPYGRKSKIILPDSSEVWLNAGSRLVYPSPFEKNSRTLFLEGEGFFIVAENKEKPFIVKTNQLKIEALGTSFNIKAYPDEPTEEAVLAEGLVSLDFRDKLYNNNIKVQPNQKVTFSKLKKEYLVQEVIVNDYISWIDGMFIFKDQSMDIVLKRVSRYYNIEILSTKELAMKKIAGKLDLKDNYIGVLQTLALISNGSYSEHNNKIYFRPKI